MLHKANTEHVLKLAQEEPFKLTVEHMDAKIAEVVVGTTDSLNKLQQSVMQTFVMSSVGQTEDKKIIEQTFVDASYAVSALKASGIPTSASCPVAYSVERPPRKCP